MKFILIILVFSYNAQTPPPVVVGTFDTPQECHAAAQEVKNGLTDNRLVTYFRAACISQRTNKGT